MRKRGMLKTSTLEKLFPDLQKRGTAKKVGFDFFSSPFLNTKGKQRILNTLLFFRFLFYILYDVIYATTQNPTEIIYFHRADTVSFFHAVNRCTADIVFCYQCVRRNIQFFQRSPKRFIAYQQLHIPLISFNIRINCKFTLDNSHNYDYNDSMNKKKESIYYILVAFISLFMGFLLYVLFRPTTYISSYIFTYFPMLRTNYAFLFPRMRYFTYYLADFLWALSLSCGLHAIFLPKKRGSLYCTITVFLLGSSYELLQHLDVISGTGDIADIMLYVLGSGAVNIIYFTRRDTHEKKQNH